MAVFRKTLQPSDLQTRKTRQYEAVFITGSIISGTYGGDAISIFLTFLSVSGQPEILQLVVPAVIFLARCKF